MALIRGEGARLRGSLYAVAGAMLWGVSGTAAQRLLGLGLSAQWLTALRLLVAGAAILLVARPRLPRPLGSLVVTGLGLGAAQFGFFAGIAHADVATIALLQYLAIPIMAGYEIARGQLAVSPAQLGAAALAVVGAALLLFGGAAHGSMLAVSPLGLAFGCLAAVSIAVYTLVSAQLVQRNGPWATTGWASLIGAIPLSLWAPPWSTSARLFDLEVVLLIGFVVIIGTLVATALYVASLRYLSATETSVASTTEALGAAASAYGFLGVTLTPQQYAGGALILLGVVGISVYQARVRSE